MNKLVYAFIASALIVPSFSKAEETPKTETTKSNVVTSQNSNNNTSITKEVVSDIIGMEPCSSDCNKCECEECNCEEQKCEACNCDCGCTENKEVIAQK